MLAEIKRVFKDSTIYGLGSLLPRAAAIVLTPIYTAYLTRDDYGVMSFALLVMSMTGIFMVLGQNGSLVLYYRATAEGAENRRELLFSVFCFVMVFGAVILGLGFLLGPTLAPLINGSNAVSFYPFIAIALLAAFAGLPLAMQQSINRALGQAKMFTSIQLGVFALNTAFTLVFVVALHKGAYGSMLGTLIAYAGMAPVCIILLVPHMTPRFSRKSLDRSLRFGVPLVPHYIAGWLLTFADRFLLLRLSTLSQVGLYSLAYNLSMALNLFCGAINQAWGPIYYDLADTEEGRKILPRLTTVYAAAITALAIGFTLLAPDVLILLANPRFHAAAPVIPVVAGGYFFFGLYMVVSTPIFHARKTWWMPAISGSAAVVNVGINLVLIPAFGMVGAAWATLIAYLFMALVARIVTNRLRPGAYEDGKLLTLVGLYAVAFGATIAMLHVHLSLTLDVLVKFAFMVPIFIMFFVLRLISFAEVRGFLKRRRGRRAASEEEEAAIKRRDAEHTGNTSDDTGMLPDDVRP